MAVGNSHIINRDSIQSEARVCKAKSDTSLVREKQPKIHSANPMNYCDQYKKYRENAKNYIERELRSKGVQEWIIVEAVGRFEKERLTETKIIEIYLKR